MIKCCVFRAVKPVCHSVNFDAKASPARFSVDPSIMKHEVNCLIAFKYWIVKIIGWIILTVSVDVNKRGEVLRLSNGKIAVYRPIYDGLRHWIHRWIREPYLNFFSSDFPYTIPLGIF